MATTLASRFKTLIGAAACGVLLAACSSSPPLSASASCLDKQNYCLDQCNSSHSNSGLATALGLALAKPKTEAERQRAAQIQQQQTAKDNQARLQCRGGCDTQAEMCRRRM